MEMLAGGIDVFLVDLHDVIVFKDFILLESREGGSDDSHAIIVR